MAKLRKWISKHHCTDTATAAEMFRNQMAVITWATQSTNTIEIAVNKIEARNVSRAYTAQYAFAFTHIAAALPIYYRCCIQYRENIL